MPGVLLQVAVEVRPLRHAAGADEHDVLLAQLDLLPLRRLLQVLGGDGVAVGQAVDALHPGDVEQDAARDHRRVLLGPALVPDPAAEVACPPSSRSRTCRSGRGG